MPVAKITIKNKVEKTEEQKKKKKDNIHIIGVLEKRAIMYKKYLKI